MYFIKSETSDSFVNHFDGNFAYLKTLDFYFNKPYGLCGRAELRSCLKVQVAVPGSPSLIIKPGGFCGRTKTLKHSAMQRSWPDKRMPGEVTMHTWLTSFPPSHFLLHRTATLHTQRTCSHYPPPHDTAVIATGAATRSLWLRT